MNPQEMVVAIVLIVMVATVIKARYRSGPGPDRGDDTESLRMKEEVRALKERIQVLERIATDKESQLEREIERLRDR